MLKWEKKILDFVDKHTNIFFVLGITILSMGIRLFLRSIVSDDMAGFLLPWYEEIKSNGGMTGLSKQVGNYNLLYQFIIAIITYLPIKPMYAYKMLSIIFDYFLALSVAGLVHELSSDNKGKKAIFAYAFVILSPIVFLNSAAWGQCDAIYVTFLVLSLWCLLGDKYKRAFIFLGLSFSFKLQAVFVIPFFLAYYFYKKRYTIFYFFTIPCVMLLTALPTIIIGNRNWLAVFGVYKTQVGAYKYQYMNYPSFWALFTPADQGWYHVTAILLTIGILGILFFVWNGKREKFTKRQFLEMAFLTMYTCVLFLPSMHERYGFSYEILAIAIGVLDKKKIPIAIILSLISLCTYGRYLNGNPVNIAILSVCNIITYLVCICHFTVVSLNKVNES